MNTAQFYNQAIAFTTNALTILEDHQLFVASYQLDHLCYRVQDEKFYRTMKAFLAQDAQLLSATQIDGREISTYKLHKAIVVPGNPFRQIDVIELPAPKKKFYPTGFEHLEFVVPDIDHLQTLYPNHRFKTSNPGGVNPTISIQFPNLKVKFHERSLEEVISIEKLSSNHS